jgi:phenylacetate-CoA ligase
VSLRECHKLLALYLIECAAMTEQRREAVRSRALRRMVRHAYRRVPYYRRLFDEHGIDPRSIRGVADLACIPVTRKQDILTLPAENLVAEGVDPERLFQISTSGSTGQPLTIRRTWAEQKVTALRALYAHFREGLRPTDMRVAVSLSRRREGQRRSAPKRLLSPLGIGRGRHVDCALPREEIMRRLRRLRPDHLGGYAGVIADLAARSTPADREAIRPRMVAVNSELLTPGMRQTITDVFGVEPFDRYGCHELGLLAWECREAHGLHLGRFGTICEILSDGRPARAGETGRLIGTSLYCAAMPFIRYDTGDAVTFAGNRCRCGARVPALSHIDGRTIHFFPLPGGDRLHAYEIVKPLKASAPWMLQFQIVQEGPRAITVRLVPRPPGKGGDIESVRSDLQAAVGDRVLIQVCTVERIDPDPRTGKFPVFVPAAVPPTVPDSA